VLKQRAAGYNIVGRTFVNAYYIDMSNTFAAGDMYSTVEDLYRWDQALYSDLILDGQSREAMFTPYIPLPSPADSLTARGDYGYGWEIGEVAGHRVFSHEGSLPGFHALLQRFPDDYVTIIILSNIQTSDVQALAGDLAEIVFTGEN
jgi:CubicO group peptidase (beta-lactamase class C family)